MTVEGLVVCSSVHDPRRTMDELVAAVERRGMTVMARIDHAAAAAQAGMALRPTELLIFGNPRAGTPLMQAAQTMGIDLPLKALVWMDASGQTWLAYDEPRFLARRHGIGSGLEALLDTMDGALRGAASEATRRHAGDPS